MINKSVSIKHLLLLFLTVVITLAFGQEKPDFAKVSIDATAWRYVGPDRGGRSCTVTGLEGNPFLYYAGFTGGGVWKSIDAGISWENISDAYFGGSIGAIAVSQSNPNIIYVGEGEKTIRGDVSSGRGVWKSTDAGKTWNHMGLDKSMQIGRIRIHPKNPNIVYVAVIGNLWKSSPERGVYKSIDGGKNWNLILFSNEDAGAIDLILDPSNPEIIYTTTYKVRRNGYRLDSGGEGSHLWKSTDGGKSWVILTENRGMPKGILGNIGITVSPQNSQRLWAVIEAKKGGLYRSDDGGDSWIQTSDFVELYQKAYYYMRVYADPLNVDKVYVLNTRYHVSEDGGFNFKSYHGSHVDHHDLWIDSKDPKRMIIANDGGAQVSFNGGKTWSNRYNQPTAQIYRIATDNSFPYRIYGGQQDHGTLRISHLAGKRRSSLDDVRPWEETAGGESACLAPDPINPDIVYAGTYKGYMMRYDHSTKQMRSVNIWPVNPVGSGVEVMKYRFNWNYPIFFSPHNSTKLYATSNYVHVSTNEGQSWNVISPDLTRGIPKTLKSSGGPIADDNTGVEFYGTIITAMESPYEEGVIWTGSDDGLIHISRDNGKTWKDVTPPESICPKLNMINDIDVSAFNKGSAYVAATSYKFGDYTPYLYSTKDYGKTWKLITNGIPSNEFTRCIQSDPEKEALLYAGTEWGVFISFDNGLNWQKFQNNLPIVSIYDLAFKNGDLIAATHGRGFWIIEDLSLIRQSNDKVYDGNMHLFKPLDVYRPEAVSIHFNIENINSDIHIDITENNGTVVQSYSNQKKPSDKKLKLKPGINHLRWNLRYPGFIEFPVMVFYSSPNRGPYAVSGIYKVKLTVNDQTETQLFEIKKDPRLQNTDEDYENQFDFLIKVRDRVTDAHLAILEIRRIKKELRQQRIKIEKKGSGQVLKQIDKLFAELDIVENNLNQNKSIGGRDPLKYGIKLNNKMAFLLADQQRGDFPPTDQAKEVFKLLSTKIDAELMRLKEIKKVNIPKLNKNLSRYGIKKIND